MSLPSSFKKAVAARAAAADAASVETLRKARQALAAAKDKARVLKWRTGDVAVLPLDLWVALAAALEG